MCNNLLVGWLFRLILKWETFEDGLEMLHKLLKWLTSQILFFLNLTFLYNFFYIYFCIYKFKAGLLKLSEIYRNIK